MLKAVAAFAHKNTYRNTPPPVSARADKWLPVSSVYDQSVQKINSAQANWINTFYHSKIFCKK